MRNLEGSILSSPERSEGRIEGCGVDPICGVRRTLRYALHFVCATQDAGYLITHNPLLKLTREERYE